jgi:hypothetical protein
MPRPLDDERQIAGWIGRCRRKSVELEREAIAVVPHRRRPDGRAHRGARAVVLRDRR